MTSRISLTGSWIQIATGASIVSCEGAIEVAYSDTAPAAGDNGHDLETESDPLQYAGASKTWVRARWPGSIAIVSGTGAVAAIAPVATVAPIVTSLPSISPAHPSPSDDVTVGVGAATGVPAPQLAAARMTVNGRPAPVDQALRLNDGDQWQVDVEWTNGVPPNATASASGTVSQVPQVPLAAPAALAANQITVAPIATNTTQVTIRWNALPPDGGAPITGAFVDVAGGAPVQLAGFLADTDYPVTVPAGATSAIRLWFENGQTPVNKSPAVNATPWVVASNTHTVTLTAAPAARIFFDTGAARGANYASIPVAGTTTAPAGSQIEARVIRADTLAQVHPWQTIAVAGALGTWSGAFVGAQRHSADLQLEVRVAGSTATPARRADMIVLGHIALLLGQSEDARMFDDTLDNRTYQTAAALTAGRVWFMSNRNTANLLEQFATYGIKEATDAAVTQRIVNGGITTAMSHLAATLVANAPNDRLLFIDAARSGTNRVEISNDHGPGADTDRNWQASLKGAVDIIRAWGGDVGVVMDTWAAADSQNGDDFRLKFYPFYTGMEAPDHPLLAGIGGNRVVAVGSTALGGASGAGGVKYDHFLFDLSGLNRPEALFDPAVTKWAEHGPHRFEDFNPGAGTLLTDKQDTRVSLRNMIDDPDMAPIVRPKGPEILLYQNGGPSTTPGSKVYNANPATWVSWEDYTHPSDFSQDGLPARAKHTAVATLYALGIGPTAAANNWVPRFNRSHWWPDGSRCELWYEAPDGSTPVITTTRRARGNPAIPTTKVTGHPSIADGSAMPHRTEVAGFRVDGSPATNVKIEPGTFASGNVVVVYPPSGTFSRSSSIEYGRGGASGIASAATFLSDEFDGLWKNLPIALMGIAGVDGVAMEPMPAITDVSNPLPGAVPFTTASAGPSFYATGTLGANSGQLTFRFKGKTTQTNTATLFGLSAGRIGMDRLSSGQLRLILKDSANVSVLPTRAANRGLTQFMAAGVETEVILSVDLAALVAKVWVNGALSDTLTLETGTNQFDTARNLTYLSSNSAGADQFVGTVEGVGCWKAYTPTGAVAGLGAAPANYEVAGPPSAANAHPWKRGTSAALQTFSLPGGTITAEIYGAAQVVPSDDGALLVVGGAFVQAHSGQAYTLDTRFGGTQGWSNVGDMAARYAAPPALPQALSHIGSTIIAANVQSDYAGDHDSGFWTELLPIVRVTEIPAGTGRLFAPPLIKWAGRKVAPAPERIDVAAFRASLPTLSATGVAVPPAAEVIARIGSQPQLLAFDPEPNQRTYGNYFHHHFGSPSASGGNYGRNLGRTISYAALGALTDAWAATERDDVLTRLISLGRQIESFVIDQVVAGSNDFEPNGGQRQYELVPLVLYLAATGRLSDLPTILEPVAGKPQFNQFGSFIQITPQVLADLEPHTSLTKPFTARIRNVSAVAGETVTVECTRNSGTNAGDHSDFEVVGMVARKIAGGLRTGAPATITGSPQKNVTISGTVTRDLVIPGHSFVAGDQMIMDPGAAVTAYYQPGAGEYSLEGRLLYNRLTPTPTALYRDQQEGVALAVLYDVLGLTTLLRAYRDYVAHTTASPNAPYASVVFSGGWQTIAGVQYNTESTFLAQHRSAIGL
jgi:hypothetical protein